MSTLELTLFVAAALVGGMTSGVSGFAMGIVVSGVWLHMIQPEQNALLIALCGLVTQSSGIWRVRHSIRWGAVVPYVAGSAVGVPIGTLILTLVDNLTIRIGFGVLLIAYSLYGLLRPAIGPVQTSTARAVAVGVLNGLIGGLTGLGGVAITIWGQMLGGSKDAQRAVFQPVTLATFIISAITLAFAGAYSLETMSLYLLALPALMVGIVIGLKLYGTIDDASFRKVILVLVLLSGFSLILPLR